MITICLRTRLHGWEEYFYKSKLFFNILKQPVYEHNRKKISTHR
jgi:hypothetical protein